MWVLCVCLIVIFMLFLHTFFICKYSRKCYNWGVISLSTCAFMYVCMIHTIYNLWVGVHWFGSKHMPECASGNFSRYSSIISLHRNFWLLKRTLTPLHVKSHMFYLSIFLYRYNLYSYLHTYIYAYAYICLYVHIVYILPEQWFGM